MPDELPETDPVVPDEELPDTAPLLMTDSAESLPVAGGVLLVVGVLETFGVLEVVGMLEGGLSSLLAAITGMAVSVKAVAAMVMRTCFMDSSFK